MIVKMGPRSRSWIYTFVSVCLFLEINAIVPPAGPDRPFVAVHCEEYVPPGPPGPPAAKHIYISQLDQEQLDFSTNFETTESIGGLAYDSVDEKFYISRPISADTYHVDFDGSNEMVFKNGATDNIAITSSRKILGTSLDGIYMSELDGSDEMVITDSTVSGLEVVGSRIMAFRKTEILSFDTDGSELPEETYDLPTVIRDVDVDVEAGVLYYLEYESSPLILNRLRVNDYNATCVERILDSTDLHGGMKLAPENSYAPLQIAHYKDYVYVVGPAIRDSLGNVLHSGLARVNKDTGNLTDVGANAFPDDIRKCTYIHIHDPEQVAVEEDFAGATHIPLPANGGADGNGPNGNMTRNMSIPLHIKEGYFGGFIAELVIPIIGLIEDWRLEISFPRQVFKLEIEGCSAEVLTKTKRQYGRRTGTDYVIVPTAESRSPSSGEDLKITLLGKTFKKVRDMKRGTSVLFIPIQREQVDLSCDRLA